ncbi:MAG: choice-of-anchor T family protein [Thermoplasmatota archaeon]
MQLIYCCQRSRVSSFLILLVLVFLILSSLSQAEESEDESSDLPPPTIWIEMDQEEVHADVAPGDNGIVMFTGTCHCILPSEVNNTVYTIVSLDMEASGFPCSDPPGLLFTNDMEIRKFLISVQVPVSGGMVDGLKANNAFIVTIRICYEYPPDGWKHFVETVRPCRIIIDQYSRLQINREVITQRTPVGKWREANLYLQNLGNGNDTVHLEIGSMSKNMNAELDREFLELEYGSEAEFRIRLRQRTGSGGINHVRIRAWSDVKGSDNETVYEMPFLTKSSFVGFIRTPSQYLPVISILLIIIIVVVWALLRNRLFPDKD